MAKSAATFLHGYRNTAWTEDQWLSRIFPSLLCQSRLMSAPTSWTEQVPFQMWNEYSPHMLLVGSDLKERLATLNTLSIEIHNMTQ